MLIFAIFLFSLAITLITLFLISLYRYIDVTSQTPKSYPITLERSREHSDIWVAEVDRFMKVLNEMDSDRKTVEHLGCQ